ncbi:MAG: FeoB-associated Cys-rich membrane protein [Verrucomicrobiales bacterium]|nr:FeoB-associated Cys-rich membrane protein [Verrucomicrobiales bacterium]
MASNWQSWITLAIIAITAIAFIGLAIAKRRKKSDSSACGSNCGCPSSTISKDLKKPSSPK